MTTSTPPVSSTSDAPAPAAVRRGTAGTTAEAPAAAQAAGFAVTWDDPTDAERTWVMDPEHFCWPFSPLSVDHTSVILEQIGNLRELRAHERGRVIFAKGYCYWMRRPKPAPDAPPDPVVEERKQRDEALAARIEDVWRRELEPEIRALCHGVRDRDYDALSAAEIADVLEGCFADVGRGFALTNAIAAPGMFAALRPFTAFCKETFPEENADALVGAMVGGFANYTVDSEVAVWRLARRAAAIPGVRRTLLSHVPGEVGAALRRLPEAAPFRHAVDAYLDVYGWRPELWCELTLPTWVEDPSPLYARIRDYVERPAADPRRAQRRAASRRRSTVRRCRARLASDAEKLARFDELLGRAQQYVPVRENRALWQLTVTGVLRVPCLALGRALCGAGVLDAPDDVFFLRLDELRRLARTGRPGSSEGSDHRHVIAARREERAAMLRIVPPLVIGTLDPAARDEMASNMGRFADLGFEEERAGHDGQTIILRGGAASRGVVRARAKVIRTMAEAGKLAPGEVLVCRTTSPAWTPLVARAGAVVADAGGILAHCAIVAREHAIPCVVGTGMATQRIRDGMLVTVDGTQGLVRLDEVGEASGDPRGPGDRPDPHDPRDPVEVNRTRPEATRATRRSRTRSTERAGRAARGDDKRGSSTAANAAAGTAASTASGAASRGGTTDGAGWIVWLDEPACQAPQLTGGKAANLSRLAVTATHRVPPGFCLTTAAYEAAHEAGLRGAGASSQAAPALPEPLRRELGAAYARLAARCGETQPRVAVRSSAVDEDGQTASFAGQYETMLNVVGETALAEAVLRCWRSLDAAAAQAYRARRGLVTAGARLAVLVQQLVPADTAAVLFSANPVTGSRDEALLSASYGLGESIVGGAVTPDTYVVRKRGPEGPRIVSRTLGDKALMTVLPPAGTSGATGTREVAVPVALRARPELGDTEVLAAARLGMALEAEMGWPVDVECAWKDGVLYVLQCRPITTLE